MEYTDQQLLRRADRDPGAYVAFYDRHERAVVAFVGAMVRDADVTIDVVAETFARAYQARDSFRERGQRTGLAARGSRRHVVLASWRRGRVESAARQ